MRKRGRKVALCIVGAAAFAVAGCREEQVEARAVPDLAACKAAAALDGEFTAADCDAANAEAVALHAETAPRYDSLEVCEEQHGPGVCGTEEQVAQGGGSGGIFMPLMMGYLMGSMLGGRGMAAQPLYRNSSGQYTNATGSSTYGSNNGKATVGASQFNKPPTTAGKAPMTKASVASRGGFGASGTRAGSSLGG